MFKIAHLAWILDVESNDLNSDKDIFLATQRLPENWKFIQFEATIHIKGTNIQKTMICSNDKCQFSFRQI